MGVGSGLKVTFESTSSICLSAASIRAREAGSSRITGLPPEKSIALPSWIGTTAGDRAPARGWEA